MKKNKVDSLYAYPWAALEEEFRSGKRESLPIVGFGSLLNVASARRNFPDAPDPAKPLRVFGFQRVYDYFVRSESYDKYSANYLGYQPCALNAYPSPAHWLNGVELTLTAELFEAFRQREKFYDLHPAKACPFDQNEPDRVCYILSKKPTTTSNLELMQPHPHYHTVCARGALDVSEEFLNAFQETTWFADRQTNILQRISTSAIHLRKLKI